MYMGITNINRGVGWGTGSPKKGVAMMFNFSFRLNAFRIAFIYLVLSVFWIMYSDQFLAYYFESQQLMAQYQTIKGLAFVGITTLIIFMLIKASQSRLEDAHNDIKETEKRYRLLVNESPFMIGLLQDGQVSYANSVACEVLERDQSELISTGIEKIVHPDTLEEAKDRLSRLKNGETDLYPTREKYLSATGKVIPVEVHATAFTYKQKDAVQIIAMDISDRVTREQVLERTLEEKGILISEIHHRVKNNLAIISALIQLQTFQETEGATTEALLMSLRRISSIALIHEHVYQSDDLVTIRFDELITELVAESNKYTGQADIEQEIDANPVAINVNQAVPCALFLNEALNIIYKDIPGSPAGRLLNIKLNQQDKTCTISVGLHNNGKSPIAIEEKDDALPFQLLELIGQQLNGKTAITVDNEGVDITLQFTLDEKLSGSSAAISV